MLIIPVARFYNKIAVRMGVAQRGLVYIILTFTISFVKADLKRTIAVLLDDILNRLVKLEGKVDAAVNASAHNISHPSRGAGTLLAAGLTVSRPTKQHLPTHRRDRRTNPLQFPPQSPDRPH